ncbi:hypothetical protein Neosp_015218 [[Neocosmospora] mangrovei]
MRLINVKTGQLEQFFGSSIPRYMILSHTWGSDEISFQDAEQIAKQGRGFLSRKARRLKKLVGYFKIVDFCAKIVERCSDIEYAWIDTCCIGKASSAELSEAINSMFQWYEQAEACFAYLCDVSAGQDPRTVGSDFRKSRWFIRGWTLQELLAPFRVVLFDGSWNKIGRRDSLGSVIEQVTSISSAYISGTADTSTGFYRNRRVVLSGASVAERMSWAATRETTREEDMAYCLLGLF